MELKLGGSIPAAYQRKAGLYIAVEQHLVLNADIAERSSVTTGFLNLRLMLQLDGSFSWYFNHGIIL